MAMVELAASRRAVVRSERFMEWQRELIRENSYGGRKRQHPDESPSDNYFAPKKSDEEQEGEEDQAQEEKREIEEQDASEMNHVADAAANGDESEIKKQQQKKRLNAKKRIRRFQGSSKRDRQQEKSIAPLRRTQRRILAASERNFRFFTRSRATSPPAEATEANRGSKRSKRVAQKLANEEPPPPPLRLPKLHLVLTRKEIQEDWMKITGHKYTGKPKKSTLVQRGFGLCTSLTCPSSIRYLNDPQ